MELRINKLIFFILTIVCFCCEANNGFKRLRISNFVITVPSNWDKIEMKGIDSYVSAIATREDTLYVGFGDFEGPYVEDIRIYSISEKSKRPKTREGATIIFSDTPEEDIKSRKYHKQVIRLDTIGGYPVQLTYPKEGEIGVIEMFIKDVVPGKNFVMIGRNLSSSKKEEVLKIFYSLGFDTSIN